MCSLPRKDYYIHSHPLPAALSFPVECALSCGDRNAAWTRKPLSQPTEKLGAQTLIGLKTERGIRYRLGQESLKLRRLITTSRGTSGVWSAEGSLLLMNLPSYRHRDW